MINTDNRLNDDRDTENLIKNQYKSEVETDLK